MNRPTVQRSLDAGPWRGRTEDLRGGLMVCGTTSNSGKTTVVAGLCRALSRAGVRVAPFKAQNMALNSAVTSDGHEIGRAQYLQAQAAGIEPEVAMNPVLLKPTGERSSQVVVMGRPIGVMSAVEYHDAKSELFSLVLEALADLRSRFDVVLVEGAGSPAEINLLDRDIVNLRLADAAGVPAVVVGDIDPGGVFASLYGTVSVLPDELRARIGGFLINKLRGDPALLLDGTDQLAELSGVPTLGVIPMLPDLRLDAEDSLTLDRSEGSPLDADASLDVAVIRLPRISNFTDLDALAVEPDVAVRYVRSARELGRPDLVVLPGSKATVSDLDWLRARGLDRAIAALDATTTVLGICGGYQMLGRSIDDEVESGHGVSAGLGMLPVETSFAADKVLACRTGTALGEAVTGYQIHHGRVAAPADHTDDVGPQVWLRLDDEPEGIRANRVFGTTLHGLFDEDGFRRRFLAEVAKCAGTTFTPGDRTPADERNDQLDRLADHLEASIDLPALGALIASAAAAPDHSPHRELSAEPC
ncbi:MAG: cobyric acid synthase [Ilumatobacteraceae bacterium]|nr:cobyric acid synthase [Ilumatobacteraceae bacterium]